MIRSSANYNLIIQLSTKKKCDNHHIITVLFRVFFQSSQGYKYPSQSPSFLQCSFREKLNPRSAIFLSNFGNPDVSQFHTNLFDYSWRICKNNIMHYNYDCSKFWIISLRFDHKSMLAILSALLFWSLLSGWIVIKKKIIFVCLHLFRWHI